MADLARIEIEQDDVGWVLRVTNPGMRSQEYRCATKEQAQKLADVMTGKPGAGAASSKSSPPPAAKQPPAAPASKLPPIKRG